MKLIIVDDHSLFRSGLVNLFNSQPDFEVVGEAGTIKEAIQLVETHHPDLVILDVGLPDGSGFDAIPSILRMAENINIVFLTIHGSDESAFAAIRLGAKGFLIKDIAAPALLAALRGLERGELAIPRATLNRFINGFLPLFSLRGSEWNGEEPTLTTREIDVLMALGAGDTNREIAQRLSISENTAKVHVHNILHKLKLNNRQEAGTYARRLGLVKTL